MHQGPEISIEALRTWQRESQPQRVLQSLPQGDRHPDPEIRLIYGICLAMQGRAEAAKGVLLSLIDAYEPHSVMAQSDLGLACLLSGRIEAASRWLEPVVADPSATAVEYSRMGALRLLQSRLEDARACYAEAVSREPGRAEWHNNLGGILVRLQLLEEALEQYDIALQCDPDLSRAAQSRLKVLGALERTADVVDELEKQLDAEPDRVDLRIRLARAYELDDQLLKAANLIRQALVRPDAATPPECLDQLQLRQVLAELLIKRGRSYPALRILEAAERFTPAPAQIIAQQALQWTELGQPDKAMAVMADALAVDPDDPAVQIMEARVLSESGDLKEAEFRLRSLLEIYPGDAGLMIQLGQTLMWVGKLDEAADCFKEASNINPMALAALANTNKLPEDDKSIAVMEALAENPLLDARVRSDMAFSVARIHEKTGNVDQSARFLKMANDLVYRRLDFRPKAFTKRVDAVTEIFSKAFFGRLPMIRKSNRTILFVVGMPRSGTTLTEQILSAHPEVFGAGELPYMPKLGALIPQVLGVKQPFPFCAPDLTPHHREEAARYYLHQLDLLGVDTPYVVDKMPHNFVNLGLIAMVFPNAKIIHVNRDPRDTAVSNYQQNFKARHGGLGYAFDLAAIARQINDYHRLMTHWRHVLPLPIFDLAYEEMVEDMEATAEKLLDFVGLSWHADVRRFYEAKRAVRTASVAQVRQPIYKTSMKKWRRYERHLDDLLTNLNPEVTEPYDHPTDIYNPYQSRIVHQGRIIPFQNMEKIAR